MQEEEASVRQKTDYVHVFMLVSLSFLLVAPAIFVKDSLIGEGVDLYGTIWFYQWIADCIFHIQNPSHTELFFYPHGKDIFGHTGNNFVDAILAAPFVWLFGFPLFQPIFYGVILFLNGYSFYLLSKDLFVNKHAQIGASLLFLLSPYILSELIQGRPTQALLVFSVLSIRHALRMMSQSQRKDALLCGIYTALQGWTYWFGGFFLGLVLICVIGVQAQKKDGKRYAMALCACLLGIAPGVLAMIVHMQQQNVPGLVDSVQPFWTIPKIDPKQENSYLVGYLLNEPIGMKMFGLFSVSVPLLWALWKGKQRRIWGVGLLVSLLIATGPVYFDGDTPQPLYHYILLYRILPFFSRLWFPYRMVSLALLFAFVGIGFALDRVQQNKGRWVVVALIVASLFEQSQTFCVPLLYQQWKKPDLYQELEAEPAPIIELPIGFVRPSILWQSQHKMPTFGGMGENLPVLVPKEHQLRLQSSLYRHFRKIVFFPDTTAQPPPLLDAQKEGFRYITCDFDIVLGLYHRDEEETQQEKIQQVQRHLIAWLGLPRWTEGSLWGWDVHVETTKTKVLIPKKDSSIQPTDFEQYLMHRNTRSGSDR